MFANNIMKQKSREYGIREVANTTKANHLSYEVFLKSEIVLYDSMTELKALSCEIADFLNARSGAYEITKSTKRFKRMDINKLIQRVRFENESDVMIFSIMFGHVIQKIFKYV